MAEVVEVSAAGELRDAVLIAGFTTRLRAGRLGTNTIAHLVDEWQAELIAKIDSQDGFDFHYRRPVSRYRGNQRVIVWPDTSIYRARPLAGRRDFVFAGGFEPNFHWRDFVEALGRYMGRIGVRTLICLRGSPGSVPHSRPVPVLLNASDAQIAIELGGPMHGFRPEGPADLLAVLSAHGQSLGWRTADLTAVQPVYFPRMPNAQATIALIKALDRAYGTSTSVATLERTAAEQELRLAEEAAASAEVSSTLAELERRFDAGLAQREFLTPGVEAPGVLADEVLEEVERLLEGDAPD